MLHLVTRRFGVNKKWTTVVERTSSPLRHPTTDWKSVLPQHSGVALLRQIITVILLTTFTTLATAADTLNGVMLSDEQVTAAELTRLKSAADGSAVVLQLNGITAQEQQREESAAARIVESGLTLYYWIEIARCEELADAHPEWMASLQGHPEWRRLFKDAPIPLEKTEVVKNYPWVPIFYKEAFDAHVARVTRLLANKPQAAGIFLNDLQGAPSACGCGNTLCRWTTDYGPIQTATPLKDDAAALFVAAISQLAPNSTVIPVWLTECEEHDCEEDGVCGGVGCFNGICWKAWNRQLQPVAEQSDRIAVLMPFRMFERDSPRYGEAGAWIGHALKMFQSMPVKQNSKPIEPHRLIAIVQGWDVSEADIAAQKHHAEVTGAAGTIIVRTPINQSWKPVLHQLK